MGARNLNRSPQIWQDDPQNICLHQTFGCPRRIRRLGNVEVCLPWILWLGLKLEAVSSNSGSREFARGWKTRWLQLGSLLFVEGPTGVGFSYSQPKDDQTGDNRVRFSQQLSPNNL